MRLCAAASPPRVCLISASQGPDNKPVALEIHDCGACLFCLDKPRFGGKGTKRQKCVNKKMAHVGPVKAWASLRVTSTQELQMVENFSNREPPTELTDAVEQNGPLPLVWAFPRARRARPLPPAYVLMYYCEKRVPLDRRYLFRSLEFRANPTKRNLDKVGDDNKMSSMLSLPYAEEAAALSKLPALQSMPVGSPETIGASLAAPAAPGATSGPPASLIEINTAMAEASMVVGKARAAVVLPGGASAEPARNANSSRAKPVPVAMDGLCIGTPLVTLAMTEAIHASNQSLQARLAASQGKPLPAKPKPRKPRPPSINVPEAAIKAVDDSPKGASKGAEQQHKFMWTFDANCGRLPTSEEVQQHLGSLGGAMGGAMGGGQMGCGQMGGLMGGGQMGCGQMGGLMGGAMGGQMGGTMGGTFGTPHMCIPINWLTPQATNHSAAPAAPEHEKGGMVAPSSIGAQSMMAMIDGSLLRAVVQMEGGGHACLPFTLATAAPHGLCSTIVPIEPLDSKGPPKVTLPAPDAASHGFVYTPIEQYTPPQLTTRAPPPPADVLDLVALERGVERIAPHSTAPAQRKPSRPCMTSFTARGNTRSSGSNGRASR